MRVFTILAFIVSIMFVPVVPGDSPAPAQAEPSAQVINLDQLEEISPDNMDRIIELATYDTGHNLTAVAVDKRTYNLAYGTDEGLVFEWDLNDDSHVRYFNRRGHFDEIIGVAYVYESPVSAPIAASADGQVMYWGVADGLIMSPASPEGATQLAVDNESTVIVGSYNEYNMRVFSAYVQDNDEFFLNTYDIYAIANALEFSPRETFLAMGDTRGVTVWLWDYGNMMSGELESYRQFESDIGFIYDLAFNYDEQVLAGASHTGGLQIWGMESAASAYTDTTSGLARSLDFNQGDVLAVGGDSGNLTFYDVYSLEDGGVSPPTRHNGAITDMDFDSTNKVLATVSEDGMVKLWGVPINEGHVGGMPNNGRTVNHNGFLGNFSNNCGTSFSVNGTLPGNAVEQWSFQGDSGPVYSLELSAAEINMDFVSVAITSSSGLVDVLDNSSTSNNSRIVGGTFLLPESSSTYEIVITNDNQTGAQYSLNVTCQQENSGNSNNQNNNNNTGQNVQHCTGTPVSQVSIGIEARVTFTDGTPTNLRNGPGGGAIRQMPEGTTFTVIGGPRCAGDFTWWQLQLPDGTTGWSAEGDFEIYYIEPVPGSGGNG